MPKLVSLYIRSIAIGFALSTGFVVALVAMDVAGLRGLILGSEIGWIAALMMIVFNGVVFSAAQFGFAVMQMAEDGPRRPRGGRPVGLVPVPVPVPVRVAQTSAKSRLPRR
ncbi:MAG: hypothetical protein RIT14_304 [Pseudomonadota bacterium]